MNIFILTEEKPKISVIKQLIEIYKSDFGASYTLSSKQSVIPIFKNNLFTFTYKVEGISVKGIDSILIKTVSGESSFMDFLFYVQENAPVENSETETPLFAVEETKTSDDESRNTGVFQRCSKFVYIKPYYTIPLYMLYNDELELRESKKPSDTSIFGTNMLLTCGVKIVGKPIAKWFYKFNTIDELINFKNSMRKPPEGNTPITIKKDGDTIYISGRLDKPKNEGKIAHDPNIGALTMISNTLRLLGWTGRIIITMHGVEQQYIDNLNHGNKFLYIADLLGIELENITIRHRFPMADSYWHYEMSSEKMASILFHVSCEYVGLKEVYQNHAGCERGYFKTASGSLLTVPKYCGENSSGNTIALENKNTPAMNKRNLLIPDVIMRDDERKIIYLIEGKKLSTIDAGLQEIQEYDDIEGLYVSKYFPGYTIKRYLTIFGGRHTSLVNDKILLYLSNNGTTIINDAEKILKEKIKKAIID